jgi:THAP4-like, heme-binding beta-barrel domain
VSDLVRGPLHADLAPLAFLLGTWLGSGRGEYPTIDPFDYEERLRFEHVGDTFLLYEQESWSPADGSPIHFERGFLLPGEGGRIEWTLAQPIGLTEISEGPLDGTGFDLASTSVERSSTGMNAVALLRRYRVEGDVLRYETDMATAETSMARHLSAELHRVQG